MNFLKLQIVRLAPLLLLVLADCAGRPVGTLQPVAERAPGTSRVDLLVATTRTAKDAAPGEIFTGERGFAMSFASIAVSIPPDAQRKSGEVAWPSKIGDPATEFVAISADKLDKEVAVERFHKTLSKAPGRRVLVFVHGFNTRFEEAVFRFAQILHDSKADAVPVLFTWPSRGKLLAYAYDRESTNYSRDALERLLAELARDKSVGEVSILAHSMGNWVTLEALRQMSIRQGRIPAKITNIMLAAPDVDVDVFRSQVRDFGTPRPRLTLFVSQDDQALALSRWLGGDVQRLGAINPEAEPYRSDLQRENIKVIDLTTLKSDDPLRHGKFAESSELVRLIGERMVDGQQIGETKLGIGERIGQATTGAALTVGSAATLVISAPIAIVDGRTRQTWGDQAEELGANGKETLKSAGNVVGRIDR